MTDAVLGATETVEMDELVVGDTIEVWWQPNRDTITFLSTYKGRLECLKGGKTAYFAILTSGMTLEPGSRYRRVIKRA